VLIVAQACLAAIGRKAMKFPFAWGRSTMNPGFVRNITRSWMIVRRGMRSPMTGRNIAELGANIHVRQRGDDAAIESEIFRVRSE